jgi:DNA-binding response OmpR family regulator
MEWPVFAGNRCSMKQTTLVIDDDPDTRNILRHSLTSAGFEVFTARNGVEGLQLVEEKAPDLLILDLSLPDIDGTEICRRVHQDMGIPILMVTGRKSRTDLLNGLDIGADDYICKPFDPKELVARVKAVLRRTHPDPIAEHRNGAAVLQCGDLTVNVANYQVFQGGEELFLTGIEFRLLVLLIKEPGRLVSRAEAMVAVYGNTYDRDIRTVDSHIAHLRKKLGASSPNGPRIQNVYGLGYRLAG